MCVGLDGSALFKSQFSMVLKAECAEAIVQLEASHTEEAQSCFAAQQSRTTRL